MKALVVDDHEYTRAGISRILIDSFSGMKVSQAGNYDDAMKYFNDEQYDIIILDVNIPGKDGLDILKSIRETNSKVPVLVLSMVPISQYVRRIIKTGASGYLTKSEPAEELLKAVRTIMGGMKYFSPEVQQELPEVIDEAIEHPKHLELSNREFEILRRFAEGKNAKQIAAEYNIAINTVNIYRKRVLVKLHAKSTLELIKYAYENKIVK